MGFYGQVIQILKKGFDIVKVNNIKATSEALSGTLTFGSTKSIHAGYNANNEIVFQVEIDELDIDATTTINEEGEE